MITTYFKNTVMDNLFHTAAAGSPSLPAKYYLAWSSTATTENGATFTEPNASTGYARVEITNLANSADGVVSNIAKLTFNESTANQGVTMAYGIFDALSNGNLLIYDNIVEADRKTIENGTTFYVKPNEVKFTFKGL